MSCTEFQPYSFTYSKFSNEWRGFFGSIWCLAWSGSGCKLSARFIFDQSKWGPFLFSILKLKTSLGQSTYFLFIVLWFSKKKKGNETLVIVELYSKKEILFHIIKTIKNHQSNRVILRMKGRCSKYISQELFICTWETLIIFSM